MPKFEWEGEWVSYNRFVWKPKDFRLVDYNPEHVWAVSCGCDLHGDHLGCKRDCKDHLGCFHPLKVDVVCIRVTNEGTEADEVEHLQVPTHNRPRKGKSASDIRKDLEDLKVDLDMTMGPYRQMENPRSVCFHVARRIEQILGG